MAKEYITINGVGGGIAKTVTAGYHKNYAASLLNFGTSGTFIMERETEPKIIQVGTLDPNRLIKNAPDSAVFSPNGVSPTIKAQGNNQIIKIMEEPKIIQSPHGYQKGSVQDQCPTITSSAFQDNNFLCEPQRKALEQVQRMCEKRRGGRGHATLEKDGTIRGNYLAGGNHDSSISEMIIQYEVNPALTVTTAHKPKCYGESTDWRIRKLTERECFRLMDVDDNDIDKIKAAGIPKTQQYKLAGNSIVCSCLYHIFRKLFIEQQNESRQLELF